MTSGARRARSAEPTSWPGTGRSAGARARFVAPRVMGITQGLGAVLLLPVAIGVQAGIQTIGLGVYAAVFLVAGWPASARSRPSSGCGGPVASGWRGGASGRPSPRRRGLHQHRDARGRRRGLRALPLHLRDQRPGGDCRYAILLSAVSALPPSSPRRSSAGCSAGARHPAPCASPSSCEAAGSSSPPRLPGNPLAWLVLLVVGRHRLRGCLGRHGCRRTSASFA